LTIFTAYLAAANDTPTAPNALGDSIFEEAEDFAYGFGMGMQKNQKVESQCVTSVEATMTWAKDVESSLISCLTFKFD
jgi:hypothetical protein